MRVIISALISAALFLALAVPAVAWDTSGTANVNATSGTDIDLSSRYASGEANSFWLSLWIAKDGEAPGDDDVNATIKTSPYGTAYFEEATVTFLDGTTAATAVPLAGNATVIRTIKLEDWPADALNLSFTADSAVEGASNWVIGYTIHGE